MQAKYYLGAAAAVGLICASGVDLPSDLSTFAGVAFARGHGHYRHYSRSSHRKVVQSRRPKAERVAASREQAAPKPPAAPAAPTPVNEEEHRAKLQRALEAKAQQIALARSSETTGSLAQLASAQNTDHVPLPKAQPRSVSFDFESGLKTTVYPGDLVVREGFDVAAAKSLAAAPPSEPIVARAKP